jgi:hypothetical protein
MQSIPDQEGALTKPESKTGGVDPGLNPQTPKVSLAGMPDNGPNAGACGGDIMRVRHFNLRILFWAWTWDCKKGKL